MVVDDATLLPPVRWVSTKLAAQGNVSSAERWCFVVVVFAVQFKGELQWIGTWNVLKWRNHSVLWIFYVPVLLNFHNCWLIELYSHQSSGSASCHYYRIARYKEPQRNHARQVYRGDGVSEREWLWLSICLFLFTWWCKCNVAWRSTRSGEWHLVVQLESGRHGLWSVDRRLLRIYMSWVHIHFYMFAYKDAIICHGGTGL